MKTIVSVLSILILSLGLTACNTMKGLGQDVEKGGEKVQNSADKNQSQ
jgi:entericidin B